MAWIKKMFFLSLLVFCLSLLFWGVYNISFKSDASKEEISENTLEEENNSEEAGIIKKSSSSEISLISDEAVISPIISENGNTIKYYSKNNGKAFQIDFEGNGKRAISEKELIGLNNVFWSSDKSKVISKFVNLKMIPRFYYYDYIENKGVQLKDNIDEIVWHKNNNKIFYKHFEPSTKQRTLNIADPDGKNWKKLTDISFRNISIAQIPQTGSVSFWNKPDAYSETILKKISIIGSEEKIIFNNGYGADYLWNNNGTKILMSRLNEEASNKIQLFILNENGGEIKALNIPTIISKCVWSKDSETVYYALPGSIPDSSIMPNDYNEGKFNSIDTFWKINLSSGEKERIIDLDKIKDKYDAKELFLSPDEGILFFINRYDDKLYRITL